PPFPPPPPSVSLPPPPPPPTSFPPPPGVSLPLPPSASLPPPPPAPLPALPLISDTLGNSADANPYAANQVWIMQISQENGRGRMNMDTGTELSVQKPGECYQGQQ
ncbi:hypothetical protein Tco_1497100, partial [Tanacetum coccineum]